MDLQDFITVVPSFRQLRHPERITLLGWYLHTHKGKEQFSTSDIRQCYELLHLEVPNIADVLAKLASRKPPTLLKKNYQYRLEMRARQELDSKYSNRPVSIAIEKTLAALPSKLADESKRKYLDEALNCYRAKCYRAAILMTWNLAYDHLLNWILADPHRLSKFNGKLPSKPPFDGGKVIASRDDFEWLGEREVIDIAGHKTVAIITDNLRKILAQNLDRRNMSAHPATIEVTQVNAEDTISNLVENVVLRLA